MKKNIFLTGFAALLCACGTSPEQVAPEGGNALVNETEASQNDTATFRWSTELCDNAGMYRPAKFSEAQLKNTFDLWFGSVSLSADATVFKHQDMDKLSIDKLTAEYNEKSRQLKELNVVDLPFWQELKKQNIKQLDEEYELKKITIAAYNDPKLLLNNRFTPACKKYAEALASKDTTVLLGAWRTLVDEQKKNNGAPEELEKRFREEYRSTDKLLYAKVQLMCFGWWNCANAEITHVNRDETMEKEFNKLFESVKTECSEP